MNVNGTYAGTYAGINAQYFSRNEHALYWTVNDATMMLNLLWHFLVPSSVELKITKKHHADG